MSAAETSGWLRFEGLARRFAGVIALRGVDLELPARQRVLLAGPNGAGKSTLLRLLAGLATPSAGRILVDNEPLERDAAWRASAGYLDHRGLIYEPLTALENLRFAAKLRGLPADEASLEVSLADVGLEHAANRRVQGFSRGMRQRLGLARALLGDPRLLMLDEPLTGLDEAGAALLLARLERWFSTDAPRLLLVASHQVEAFGTRVDRLLVLSGGRLTLDEPAGGLSAQALRDRVRLGVAS